MNGCCFGMCLATGVPFQALLSVRLAVGLEGRLLPYGGAIGKWWNLSTPAREPGAFNDWTTSRPLSGVAKQNFFTF